MEALAELAIGDEQTILALLGLLAKERVLSHASSTHLSNPTRRTFPHEVAVEGGRYAKAKVTARALPGLAHRIDTLSR